MSVAVAVACVAGGLSLDTAAYAQGSADVTARLRRLERDIRDLQAETFGRGKDGAAAATAASAAPPPDPMPPAVVEPPQPIPDLGPMMRRVDELESGVTRLTGQLEELGYRLDQLLQQTERMQKQMDYQASQQANAQLAAPAPAPTGDQLASVAPGGDAPPLPTTPGVLGQIPAGTTLPAPAPRPDPRREFDSAMNLLSRAQYDDAGVAFRKFVETHPADERAPAALYWSGDIAYSAKKDYEAAARDFAELLKRYPDAPRAPDSMLKLAFSLFELGQMNEGCAALAALPAKYPQASATVATSARNKRRDAMCR